MNVFIVHAHENENSFCSALKDRAVNHLNSNNHSVEVSDLYKMNFNPVAGRNDFKVLSTTNHYKMQNEQLNAFKNDLYADDIRTEMEKLLRADLIIFNFPLWWFSLPAILKGWIDRIFAMGFAYGGGQGVYEKGVFSGKKAFLTITTGGPEQSFFPKGRNGDLDKILYHINHGMLYFTGMQTLEPFVVYGPSRISNEERITKLEEYSAYLDNVKNLKPIFPENEQNYN